MQPEAALARPDVPDARETALFLDVDGTLLAFAETPDAVVVDAALRTLLGDLHRACGGALALVSGRSIAALDGLFGPLELPAAGSHGLEIRTDGRIHELGIPLPDVAIDRMQALAATHAGSLFEHKRFGGALHYRRAAEHRPALTTAMHGLAREVGSGFELIEGNHVLELSAASGNKGSAIRFLSTRAPWRDRQPVFIGDDTTDEPGFEAVNAMGGLSIRVGQRPSTAARWQLDSIDAVQAWLRTLAGAN
ncbi:MAG: trehalose-phosphatase [Pseudomonadota bacterium]